MKKKDTSLVLLKILQEYYDRGKEIYTVQKGGLISFIDKDRTSDFHFVILNEKLENSYHVVRASIKPSSMSNVKEVEQNIKVSELKKHIEEWMIRMSLYNQMRHVDDIEDPIVEAFAEEYYDSFEIIDDDADVKPYSIKQIEHIESVLLQLEQKIQDEKPKYTDQSSPEVIEEIENRIQDIRESLYISTKKIIAKKISRLYGFIIKKGGPLLRTVIKEVGIEIIKSEVKKQLGM